MRVHRPHWTPTEGMRLTVEHGRTRRPTACRGRLPGTDLYAIDVATPGGGRMAVHVNLLEPDWEARGAEQYAEPGTVRAPILDPLMVAWLEGVPVGLPHTQRAMREWLTGWDVAADRAAEAVA